MGPDTKEYYELQSDIWFNECWKRMKERDAYKKQRDELINDMQNVKRKAEAFDEIKRTLNKKIPKLKVLTEEYKLKWQREGSNWVLTDYYKQIGGLEQLTQVINFIEELERGSDE